MPLVKTVYGLLEDENFLLTSPVIDFLGGGAWSRTDEMFRLHSGEVLRRLPYDGFVIDMKIDTGRSSGAFEFFVESGGERLGLSGDADDGADWRLAYCGGFMQAYVSHDGGVSWENTGGAEAALESEIFQGFRLDGDGELVITDYRVYGSPYLTVQNFPPGSLAKLTDESGAVLERHFDDNYECRFFMERNRRCTLEVFAPDETEPIYASGTLGFTPGDTFLYTSEFIQLVHNNAGLDFAPVNLRSKREGFAVRNAGTETSYGLHVCVDNKSGDKVELSFDDETWTDILIIDRLTLGEERPFVVKITRNTLERQFSVKHFELYIY